MNYQLREGIRVSLPAEVVGPEIERIKARHGGFFTAGHVVEAARSPRSPIHGHFEWDDTEAGRLYREEQARLLIRCYFVVDEADRDPTPIIANVQVRDPERGRGYVSTSVALSKPDWKAQVFADVARGLRGLEARLANLRAADEARALMTRAVELLERIDTDPKPEPRRRKAAKA